MSIEIIEKLSVGNKRMHAISFVAGAAETTLVTGLDYVDYFIASPKSVTTSFYAIKQNVGSTSTALNGTLGVSGLVSGDEFHIMAYGK